MYRQTQERDTSIVELKMTDIQSAPLLKALTIMKECDICTEPKGCYTCKQKRTYRDIHLSFEKLHIHIQVQCSYMTLVSGP